MDEAARTSRRRGASSPARCPRSSTSRGSPSCAAGYDEAAATLREARRIDPSNAAVLVNLANAEARAGRVDEAIASYREALRAGSPVDYLAHNGLGAALMRRGESADAIEHFREALRLRPGYAGAQANLERALKAGSDALPRPSP